MKQESNPAVFLAEWKKDATSLSLTLKLVGHTLAQQSVLLLGWNLTNNDSVGSCSLSWTDPPLWRGLPHNTHIWKPSKAHLFQKDVQQVFILHLRALSQCLDAEDAAGESEEFLKI